MKDKSSIREFKCPTCGELFLMSEDGTNKEGVAAFEALIFAHAHSCAMGKVLEKMFL